MKRILQPVLLSIGILLALSACNEIEGVDYLNVGHPADPAAQSGKKSKMSRALVPENINMRPDLKGVGATSTPRKNRASPMTHRGSH